jgi:hypothetical protein
MAWPSDACAAIYCRYGFVAVEYCTYWEENEIPFAFCSNQFIQFEQVHKVLDTRDATLTQSLAVPRHFEAYPATRTSPPHCEPCAY